MNMHIKRADLLKARDEKINAREKAMSEFESAAVAEKFEQKSFDAAKKAVNDIDLEIKALDDEIARVDEVRELALKSVKPAPDQTNTGRVPASAESDAYVKDKSLLLGGVAKMIALSDGSVHVAKQTVSEIYGESHPVTKALVTSVGSAGGYLVPPDVMAEVIPFLAARAIVRGAGPRNIPMPRGTMTMPSQNSAATASYGAEGQNSRKSQQTVGQRVASYKKLTALVPISNDMMRYANPAIDAFVRDDLVKVMARREDAAFILSMGTELEPRGYLGFANGWVVNNGGTPGVWSKSAASVLAANGTDPADSTGGNFITSTANFTLATVAAELAGAVNKLDMANVDPVKRVWMMHPRSKNYLYNVQNSLGIYVYRDEMNKGILLGYPFLTSTQIGTSYWDAAASNKDLSFVFLVEMDEDIILDSMQLELAVSREGTYYDENNALVSAFNRDETVIRAISEHDHQMRHDQAVAVIQGVRWAPALN